MSSRLALFSGENIGYQPTLASVSIANANATTAVLAMKAGASSSILAEANTPTSSVVTSATAGEEPAYIMQLRDRAVTACFVDRDPQQCSYWNQMYASAEAARHFPGGEVDRFREDAKKEGSLWKWFYAPTWTGPVRGTTKDVSSVAIVMSQAQSNST